MSSASKKTILLLDGEAPSRSLLEYVLREESFLVATDGAANSAKELGITPSLIIGDLDSLDPLTRHHFSLVPIVKVEDQSTNDFEKALLYLIDNKQVEKLTILGLHGKRTDHFLTNLSVLLRFRDWFTDVMLFDAVQEHRLLTSSYSSVSIRRSIGSAVSIIPLPAADSVLTTGLLYPLNNERLAFGEREGLSNIVTSEEGFSIKISGGSVLVSFPQRS